MHLVLSMSFVALSIWTCAAHAQGTPARVQRSAPVVAEPSWYLGAGGGRSSITERFSDDSVAVSGATQSKLIAKRFDGMGKAFVGFKVHRHLAIEGSYFDLGTHGVEREVVSPVSGVSRHHWKVRGGALDLVPTVNVGAGLSVFGRVGVAWVRSKVEHTTEGLGGIGIADSSRTVSGTKAVWHYGLGAQYDVSRSFALRAEWEEMREGTARNTTAWDDGQGFHYRALSASAMVKF